ncbi:flagellar export protein FliJ [Balneatrix alpica]|uniref:flagellar export protein FliJ n=1 Tax=Balneatrix alpica TaxID=75684 RepID=UPI00273A2305|nr:flagellar export protein FliJ [Balneatrix alpica]
MAVARSQRLKIVLTLAERDQQKCAQLLGQARERLQQGQQQVEQLNAYQLEYRVQLQTRGQQGISAGSWLGQQQFIAKLENAIGQQQQTLQKQQQELERYLQAWRKAQARTDALRKWLQRLQQHENLQLSRQEQKQLDELVSFYQRAPA